MTNRRTVLAGLLASTLAPRSGWANLGAPDFLSAGRKADGSYALFGLTHDGQILFENPLPDRGHAAAAHPTRAHAVAFARRPGTFAVVMDCQTGQETKRLESPEGRHFYGHGVFTPDGAQLLTTENEYESGIGVIGVWDAQNDYTRIGEFSSGGVGPHDMALLPDGQTLVIANGGIETHPESGRAKLNLPLMQPNLCYCNLSGSIQEIAELPAQMHLNSIRHLHVAPDGQVAIAMQWQGDVTGAEPILALHQRGGVLRLLDQGCAEMNGYGGSVRFSSDGAQVAVTSPRGGVVQVFDVHSGVLINSHKVADVCGLGTSKAGFVISSGTGAVAQIADDQIIPIHQHPLAWDNHLVELTQS